MEVAAGNVGKLLANYLDENGRRIPILGKISINGSVKLLGIPDFIRNSGPLFVENLQSPTVPSGWGNADTSNQNWGVLPGGPYINVAMSWGSTVLVCLDYAPWSPKSPHTAVRHIHNEFRHLRRRDIMKKHSRSCNPIVNPRIHCRGNDWEVSVTE